MSRTKLLSLFLIVSGIFLLTTGIIFPTVRSLLESETTEIVSPQAFRSPAFSRQGDLPPSLVVKEEGDTPRPREFYLTIKKLGIERARVFTDLDISAPSLYRDYLKRGLGHVRGTAYPGEWGASFVLGHSALPIFYSPRNYETIFAKLGELAPGDSLLVEFGSDRLNYRVVEKKIVAAAKRPEDVLSGAGRRLVLMTCYPPGFTFQRLLINAQLEEEGSDSGQLNGKT